MAAGSVIIAESIIEHPLASVDVTVYVPAHKLINDEVMELFDQINE